MIYHNHSLTIINYKILQKTCYIGTLRIDRSDEDGPYLFLELSKNIPAFDKKKKVIMSVRDENYISQK